MKFKTLQSNFNSNASNLHLGFITSCWTISNFVFYIFILNYKQTLLDRTCRYISSEINLKYYEKKKKQAETKHTLYMYIKWITILYYFRELICIILEKGQIESIFSLEHYNFDKRKVRKKNNWQNYDFILFYWHLKYLKSQTQNDATMLHLDPGILALNNKVFVRNYEYFITCMCLRFMY